MSAHNTHNTHTHADHYLAALSQTLGETQRERPEQKSCNGFPACHRHRDGCAFLLCACVSVCAGRDHMQRVSTGDIQRFLRGSLSCDRFSSTVVTKTRLDRKITKTNEKAAVQ